MRVVAVALLLCGGCSTPPAKPANPEYAAWAEKCAPAPHTCKGDLYYLRGVGWLRVGPASQVPGWHLTSARKDPWLIEDLVVIGPTTDPERYLAASRAVEGR